MHTSFFALANILPTLMPFLKADPGECEDPSSISDLPHKICLKILEYLPLKDLGNVTLTSKPWHVLTEDESLWRPYFERLVKLPGLDLILDDMDFSQKKKLLAEVINIKNVEGIIINCRESYFIDEFIKLGYEAAKTRKIRALLYGKYGYEEDRKEAAKLNNVLAHAGNLEALKRKIEGLLYGKFGYNKNHKKLVKLNNVLARDGVLEARDLKIKGLLYGKFGYNKNHKKLVKLNDEWAQDGDLRAKERKIEGLVYGIYGYNKNPKMAVKLNNEWVKNGDLETKERKIEGLLYKKYGYDKNPTKANKLKDQLVRDSDLDVRGIKIEGCSYRNYPFNENPDFLPQYLDLLKAVR